MMDVLEKIDRMRREKGWSMYKLADEALIGQSTIANMFTRKTLPSLTTLYQICEAFGITLSEFFDEKKELSEDAKLLSLFRKLDEADRKKLIAITEALLKQKNTTD